MNQVLILALLLGEAAAFYLSGVVQVVPSSTRSFLDADLSRRTRDMTAVPGSFHQGFTVAAKRYGARGISRGLRASASGANGSYSSDMAGGDADSVESDEERPGSQQATDEDDPDDVSDVDLDAEIAKLMKGIEHGSSRNTWRNEAARRGDMDEMKMVMLLRKQMGEEDFYKVFDPRNPRIGDI